MTPGLALPRCSTVSACTDCAICGKPISETEDDPIALRADGANGAWSVETFAHSDCLNQVLRYPLGNMETHPLAERVRRGSES
jgi:hypothetical protein